jgi:REP element-mobilizing transposase RayT
MNRGGQVYYYETDALGSVNAVTDSSASVQNTYLYDAWGQVKNQTGSLANPFTYTSREVGEAVGSLGSVLVYGYNAAMARPIRVEVAGGLYHVIVRGNERRAVFRDDADRAKYLQRLAHYREKLSFQVLAYCLLDNHVHLAIETGKPPLSKVMAGLQSSYTQYFNRRHDRAGHLFQGRYKAFLVEEDPYALALIRYIHENPVKAHLVEVIVEVIGVSLGKSLGSVLVYGYNG